MTVSALQVFGQVYIPVVNYVLMALTMIVVGTFQTSARLGEAYGEPLGSTFVHTAYTEQLSYKHCVMLLNFAKMFWCQVSCACMPLP